VASRLNARQAATLTEQRAREIEAQAKKDEEDRKLRTAQTAKLARLWKAQANQLIEASINGEAFLRVGPKLIGGDQLVKLGFAIAYVDQTSFLEQQRQDEIERDEQRAAEERVFKESERLRNLEVKKLQPEVDKKIGAFIKSIEKEDRYKGMDSTKKMVVEHFLELIQNYTNNISAGKSPRGELFSQLFDGSLFVYKPIDSLRPVVQAIQDALHELEKVRRDLPDVEIDEFENFDYGLDDIEDDDEDEGADDDVPGLESFKRYLEPWECNESMDVEEHQDYFQIEWGDVAEPEIWNFQDSISAPALAWLCGEGGQAFLEAIEAEIQSAIDSASTSIQISLEWDGALSTCDIGGETYCGTPKSNQLSDILKILKYKTQEEHLEEGRTLLQVSWQ
jgi:hypothetical protein